jgi:anti-sigma regulatory factor (Ser/Thr protein kinase)
VPYRNCPACGLTLYSAAGYSTTDACPRCGRTLAGATARRSFRASPIRSGAHRFRLTGGPGAPAAARRALVELAARAQAPRAELTLLVSELVTNSVRHAAVGPDGSLDLLVGVSDDGVLRVEVSDDGHGFQPASVGPNRDLTSGWGLYLVDALADRWGVARGKPARVWFELRWKGGRPAPRDPGPARGPQLAAARDALNRLARPSGMRRPRPQQHARQRRLDESRIQDWLRQLNRD